MLKKLKCITDREFRYVDDEQIYLYPNCDVTVWLRSCEKEIILPIRGEKSGEIPSWLNGSLLRNGPGKMQFGDSKFQHLFDSAALLHKWLGNNEMISIDSVNLSIFRAFDFFQIWNRKWWSVLSMSFCEFKFLWEKSSSKSYRTEFVWHESRSGSLSLDFQTNLGHLRGPLECRQYQHFNLSIWWWVLCIHRVSDRSTVNKFNANSKRWNWLTCVFVTE